MSFEKTVKLACKPKNAPPKDKVSRHWIESHPAALTLPFCQYLEYVICRQAFAPRDAPNARLTGQSSTLPTPTMAPYKTSAVPCRCA